MKLKRCSSLVMGLACGMCLLQIAGCTVENLLLNVVNLTLSALLSQLLGSPVL